MPRCKACASRMLTGQGRGDGSDQGLAMGADAYMTASFHQGVGGREGPAGRPGVSVQSRQAPGRTGRQRAGAGCAGGGRVAVWRDLAPMSGRSSSPS